MKRLVLFVAALGVMVSAALSTAAEPAKPWRFSPETLRPFWLSETMDGESILFIKETADGPAKASLLFAPTKILSVRSSSGEVVYQEGVDYTWTPGARELVLPSGSKIVSKTPQDLRRPAGTQRHRLSHRDGNGEILFGGGHEYHDMQTVVTYTHAPDAWAGPKPSFAGDQLPRTTKMLAEKKPVVIALLGDSISTGCNASGWANTPPFQPPYHDLLTMNLEATYGGKVALRNLSLGGAATPWGLQNIGRVIDAEPDLVILAFGMNDSAGHSVEQYKKTTQAMIDAVRKARPNAEFILVATMLGNRDWTTLHHDVFPQYRDALAQLCGPGVALADMTSVWAEMLKYKKDWDLTGNGVNHPNDFGHRVYAEVLSALLIAR